MSIFWQIIRNLGPAWVWFRFCYALRRRLGILRRATRAIPWRDVEVSVVQPRVRRGLSLDKGAIGENCIEEANAILSGKFCFFGQPALVNVGITPDWFRNHLSGERAPSGKHWTEYGDFSFGDIKWIWELNRFSWAFSLARAYSRTGDRRYADGFWRLFADWCERNPPNIGPNWMCGQETAFRLIAVVFSAEEIGVPDAQREPMAKFIMVSGRRIAANLDYALSQKNNHGISECVGLITAALLLRGHDAAADWLAIGLKKLEAQLDELVYADGGFAQHSLIYHRVLLHDLCWCRSRLLIARQNIPVWLDSAGRRALEFMMMLVNHETGLAPLYGSNDGANILPLSDADFLDMRPVVQMSAAVFGMGLPLAEGLWDEAAAWMVVDLSRLRRVSWPKVPPVWHARVSGCYQVVHGRSRLFLRCPEEFLHRPAQQDMLHVDIWRDGRPIAHDGGSFSYNSKGRFSGLHEAGSHNVLTVDGIMPMRKIGRFLYLPWPSGYTQRSAGGRMRAGHDGYARQGVSWVREIIPQPSEGFKIVDRVTGAAGHHLLWHWRLFDAPWMMDADKQLVEVICSDWRYIVSWTSLPEMKCRMLPKDATSAYGWWSPRYGEAEPACSLLIEADATSDIELAIEFSPLS